MWRWRHPPPSRATAWHLDDKMTGWHQDGISTRRRKVESLAFKSQKDLKQLDEGENSTEL